MFRKDGSIPVINKARYPHRLLIFDTEAYRSTPIDGTEIQTLRMIVTRFIELNDQLEIIDQEYNYFTDSLGLFGAIDTYTRKDKTLYIYAHNIKYDLQLSGILKDLLEDKWVIKSFVFDDPPTFIKLSKHRYNLMFIDTFNYWQTSLAKLGEQLSLAKLVMPEDTADNKDWFTYCKRDVDVLSEYILNFMRYLKENDLCGMGLTLASQSFRSYRHSFMTHAINLHNRPEVLSLERASYSGGRVEAYRIGVYPQQHYYKLDVNSMYPYVMRGELYPHTLVGYSENLSLDKLIENLNRYYIIAEVKLNTSIPAYAYKSKYKLVFPVGTFTTTLHHRELQYALAHNHITEVLKVSAYEQGDLFSSYVDFFYNMKLKAELDHNPVIRHQAKIMMNSLYGKFGQCNVVSKIVPNTTELSYGRITGYSETLGKNVSVNCLGANMEVSYRKGESTYSFPAIAGAVTAYARMYLLNLMQRAKAEHVYYCDTDSLVVDSQGLDNLKAYLNDTELGMLKVEDTAIDVMVWGAKDYRFGNDLKHKGVPKSALELSEGVWSYEQFRGAKSWLSDGLDKNVEVYTKLKERKSPYDKGIVNEDNTVSPLILYR